MGKNKSFYLYRRPVQALVLRPLPSSEDEYLISQRMPEGYSYSDAMYRFPAGYRESCIIDYKDYNYDGSHSLEKQKEFILKDFTDEGFMPEEVQELIDNLEVKEGDTLSLGYDESIKWLKLHPEFESEAGQIFSKIRNEVQAEISSERNKHSKRR